jgi:prepilin-type N-terminal cleavage/methylation domain-containing protein
MTEIKKTKKAGFSLVEVLVSMFLISVGLLATVSLISANLSEIINSRNQSIAGLLAEEGAELALNVRDSGALEGASFLYFPGTDTDDCIIDPAINNLQVCGSNINKKLYYSSSPLGYYYEVSFLGGGAATRFQRKIEIDFNGTNSSDSTSAKIISMVIWGGAFPVNADGCTAAAKCAYTETILTTWKDNE